MGLLCNKQLTKNIYIYLLTFFCCHLSFFKMLLKKKALHLSSCLSEGKKEFVYSPSDWIQMTVLSAAFCQWLEPLQRSRSHSALISPDEWEKMILWRWVFLGNLSETFRQRSLVSVHLHQMYFNGIFIAMPVFAVYLPPAMLPKNWSVTAV